LDGIGGNADGPCTRNVRRSRTDQTGSNSQPRNSGHPIQQRLSGLSTNWKLILAKREARIISPQRGKENIVVPFAGDESSGSFSRNPRITRRSTGVSPGVPPVTGVLWASRSVSPTAQAQDAPVNFATSARCRCYVAFRSTGVPPGVPPVTEVLWASRPQPRRRMRLKTRDIGKMPMLRLAISSS
jgi:hypothetical protein